MPSGASQGATRMRVSMKYNGVPTACESFQYGEVEDYIVNVVSSAGFGANDAQSSLTEATASGEFSIFPNPVTRGELSINLHGVEATAVTIYNVLGQVVHKGNFENTLNVSRLETGVYILEVETATTKMVKRFIKK